MEHTEFICTNLEFMANMSGVGAGMSLGELTSDNRMVKNGKTSINAGHTHEFVVDSNGNGIAKEACHPQYPNICHTHKIVSWTVQPAESKSIDPENGAPLHPHTLMSGPASTPKTRAKGKAMRSTGGSGY